jgi:hypothetical protein
MELSSADDDTSGSATAREPSEEEMELSLEEVRNAKRKQRTRYTLICTPAICQNVRTNTLQTQNTFRRRRYGSASRRFVKRIVEALIHGYEPQSTQLVSFTFRLYPNR